MKYSDVSKIFETLALANAEYFSVTPTVLANLAKTCARSDAPIETCVLYKQNAAFPYVREYIVNGDPDVSVYLDVHTDVSAIGFTARLPFLDIGSISDADNPLSKSEYYDLVEEDCKRITRRINPFVSLIKRELSGNPLFDTAIGIHTYSLSKSQIAFSVFLYLANI